MISTELLRSKKYSQVRVWESTIYQ